MGKGSTTVERVVWGMLTGTSQTAPDPVRARFAYETELQESVKDDMARLQGEQQEERNCTARHPA